jgi:acyl-CoA synthetase (AMP-forming)/AMP-acid ligase II
MYTSGTTGRPKGAMLTHRNLTYQYFNALLSADVRSDEVHLAVAPLFHIAGLNMMTIPTFMMGGHIIIQRAFKAPKVLETIAGERVTSAFMVPAMIDSLAASDGFSETDLSSLRAIMVGGSPLPERSIRVWAERDVKIMQGYGMTEAGPGVCLLESRDALTKAGTAGRSHFWTEVRLVDPATGEDVEDGQTGEVWARGPHVMKGYWNREEATAAALQDGWYHTGDIASRDSDGFYTIKDRIKDMYISGGENVYPAEVENALLNVPGVLDAAVIGVPDERWGETGRAYVVVEPGHDDPAQLREELSARLARYKLPRDVVVVDELPRTTTGKIQKNVLRQQV